MEQTKFDVFISYSRKDYVDEVGNVRVDSEVAKIMESLTDAGITYWIDKEGIGYGIEFTKKIIEASTILLFLSTRNSNCSRWPSIEIKHADELHKYIIPVRIDDSPYNKNVLFHIVDKNFINYTVNPAKGREELVNSIKTFLKKKKETELQQEEERLKKKEQDRQRKLQEEEKKRQEELDIPNSYGQRCLCTFVLDVSGSMAGDRIDELNKALHTFYNEMLSDVAKKESLEISLITFSDVVTIVQRPALLEDIEMPVLETGGSTVLVDGVMQAIEVVTERKEWYKKYGIPYYRPWIILVTDGTPNPEQDVESLSKKIKEDIYKKRYNFLPIGVGEGVDMDVLEYFKGNIPPMKLDSHGFSQFFRWLGASMGASIFDASNLIDSNKLSAANKNDTIFISYKRQNKKTVFRIKSDIERTTNESCWIDLDGIESDAQFANVIIEAINKCKVFLFMYSHEHQLIQDYDNDWTVREINFAQKKKKRIVFINIDGSPLTDWFELMFGTKQQIDASSKTLMDKLCTDLKKWLK